MSPVRRLTAILAADAAGYSRLMGQDEEGTHERLKAHLRELVEPRIAEHRGRIVKNTGDGFLAEFPSVVDAVRCAVEVQRGMAERNAETMPEKRIEFRVGINLGDVIIEGDDIFGDGVNIAARLEALAEPGGICVSRVVRDQARDRLDYTFADMGEQSVKNIARPVRVYACRLGGAADLPKTSVPIAVPMRRRRLILAPIGAAVATALVIAIVTWWFWPVTRSSSTPPAAVATAATSIAQPLAAQRLSIVVLPFANLSNDPDQQYFADGITEDLTTDLSRIPDMLVISRNSAFTYKGKAVNAKQIGGELGVHYVLEGSVQRSGNQVRVSAQLIDAETDTHVWAERISGDTSDLFAVQDEITMRLANALGVELIAAEAARPSERPDALDYILRGRAAMNKPPSRETYADAISLFERALALNPQSVEAQSYLAFALAGRVLDEMTGSAAGDIARAQELAEQALTRTPRSPLAHFAKAQILRATGRCKEAIPEYETSLAYRNWVAALSHIGRCRIYIGPIEDAIPIEEQAIRLSPHDPGIGLWYFRIGQAHLLQSRIDEAIAWFEKARSAYSKSAGFPYRWLASAYALKGEPEQAAAALAEDQRLRGSDPQISIAQQKAFGAKFFEEPATHALFETTYIAGLRKAGVPEE